MKIFIVAAMISAMLPTMAHASSGLADRINEERSFPNKESKVTSKQMLCFQNERMHVTFSEKKVTEIPHGKIGKC